MNTQKTFILAVATLILIIGTSVLYFFAQTNTRPPTTHTLLPTGILPDTNSQINIKNVPSASSSIQENSNDTLEVATTGGTLMVSDFTKIPGVASTTDAGFFLSWFPGSDIATSSVRQPPYEIYYYPDDAFFIVVILKEPIGEIRRQATNDLKEKLGISDKEVCTLIAEVNTPYFVNSFYAAKNLGFPNCPGAEKFAGD